MELKSQFFSLVLFCDCRKEKGEKKDLVMVVKGTRNLRKLVTMTTGLWFFQGSLTPKRQDGFGAMLP